MESKIKVGTIEQGNRVGYKSRTKVIWVACPDCGKERWMQFIKNKPKNYRCRPCNAKTRWGSKITGWKGGRILHGMGYILLKLRPNDFFYSMADQKGYVFEHRLVVAKHLGRNLHRWEIVHHKNGVRDDNRRENLQLVTDDRHKQITLLENRIKHLENKADNQAKEIRLLKWQQKQGIGVSQ